MAARAELATHLVTRALDAWFQPVDPRRLDLFRRLLSLTFLLMAGSWFLDDPYEWLTTRGFHYTAETVPLGQPTPWPPMLPALVPLFAVLFFGSLVALIVGFRPRLFVWIVFAGAVYIDRVDLLSSYTANKVYVVAYAILALAPAAESFAGPDGETVRLQSAWPLRVLQATLVIHYAGSGLCKVIHGDWLASTDVVWTQIQGVYRTDAAAWMLRNAPMPVWTFLMLSGLAFELVGSWLFLFRRTRPFVIAYGILFHVGISLLMYRLILFSLQMIAFYVLFWDRSACLAYESRCAERRPAQAL